MGSYFWSLLSKNYDFRKGIRRTIIRELVMGDTASKISNEEHLVLDPLPKQQSTMWIEISLVENGRNLYFRFQRLSLKSFSGTRTR